MKKMRKLIPAFAMLMIAAIMMTTASFAWFTMNETVTATGMQVQAKASGNLLISTSKMNAAYIGMTANATDIYHTDALDRSKVNLFPITYSNGAWKVPANGTLVDPTYGTTPDTNLTNITLNTTANVQSYFGTYEFYVATAGDELKDQYLFAKINAVSGADQEIAPAYTIAFYVVANGQETPALTEDTFWNNPVATVNYKDGSAAKVVLGDNTDKFVVPSTYGKNTENAVGLKVIMRVYVDGNLDAEDTTVNVPTYVDGSGKKYTAAMASYKFYKKTADDTAEAGYTVDYSVEVDTSIWDVDDDISNYVYWDGVTTTPSTVDTKYVNNETIPSGATKFEVELSASATYPANNG